MPLKIKIKLKKLDLYINLYPLFSYSDLKSNSQIETILQKKIFSNHQSNMI